MGAYVCMYIYMQIAHVVQLECLASTEFIHTHIHRHAQLARPSHASIYSSIPAENTSPHILMDLSI